MTPTANAVTIDLPANFELVGSAELEVQYNDNVSLTSQDRQDDWITRISPSLEVSREGQLTNLSSSFTLTRGHYLNGTRPEFTDYAADLGWQWRIGSLVELRSTASYTDVAQSVTGNLDGELAPILIEAERTRSPSGEIAIAVGRQGARLQGLLRHGIRKSEFDDAVRNSTAIYSGASGTYELNGILLVGMEAVKTDLAYVEVPQIPSRDSDEIQLMATTEVRLPKTSIRLRGGRLRKNFSLDTRENFEGPRWDGRVSWSPKSYSTISFSIGKNVQESLGIASFIDVKSSSVTWTHQWGEALRSTFSHSETQGEFVGTDRFDRVKRSSFSIGYRPIDWLSVRLGASILDSSTSINVFGLENQQYFLGLEAPL
nr:outer membrane beta-barrel protein [Microbulbifer salipaludis]